jgi:hypothetical protein
MLLWVFEHHEGQDPKALALKSDQRPLLFLLGSTSTQGLAGLGEGGMICPFGTVTSLPPPTGRYWPEAGDFSPGLTVVGFLLTWSTSLPELDTQTSERLAHSGEACSLVSPTGKKDPVLVSTPSTRRGLSRSRGA